MRSVSTPLSSEASTASGQREGPLRGATNISVAERKRGAAAFVALTLGLKAGPAAGLISANSFVATSKARL